MNSYLHVCCVVYKIHIYAVCFTYICICRWSITPIVIELTAISVRKSTAVKMSLLIVWTERYNRSCQKSVRCRYQQLTTSYSNDLLILSRLSHWPYLVLMLRLLHCHLTVGVTLLESPEVFGVLKVLSISVFLNTHIYTTILLPCHAMRCTVSVIVILSVCLSVCHTRGLCPHGSTYDHDFFTIW